MSLVSDSTALRVDHATAGPALIRFDFGAPSSAPRRVPCAHLAGPAVETWHAGDVREDNGAEGVTWVHGAHYALCALTIDEADGDVETAGAAAYQRLLACVRPSTHPYLLRIWNYFAQINVGEGDAERYRRFCVGRARAVDGMFNDPPPAATAIGGDGAPARVQVLALCARAPAVALENPRQTPAWRYPREYGPVSPGFSRGAVLGAGSEAPRLLASGTASIVGHVSQHAGDVAAQLRESLANLDALLAEGQGRAQRRFARGGCEALRVYLRRADDLPAAQAVIAASGLPVDRVSYLRGDVCRRELDVEIEGVFAPE